LESGEVEADAGGADDSTADDPVRHKSWQIIDVVHWTVQEWVWNRGQKNKFKNCPNFISTNKKKIC
jgi:hypothetical protein